MINIGYMFALKAANVKLVCKADSPLMKAVDWVLFWNDDFMSSFWTTITLPFFRRIYYPAYMSREAAEQSGSIIRHEFTHTRQADGPIRAIRWVWNIGFALVYLLAPLPLGLAYFRMRWEVEAYVVGYLDRVRLGTMHYSLESYSRWVANSLWHVYGFAWPINWTRVQFIRTVQEAAA